jgi:hypothetical protein
MRLIEEMGPWRKTILPELKHPELSVKRLQHHKIIKQKFSVIFFREC